MGMFDTYHVTLTCPLDGAELADWQGKDGPCALYDWAPGRAEPRQADEGRELAALDREAHLAQFDDTKTSSLLGLSERDRRAMSMGHLVGAIGEMLPPVFTFGTTCGDHLVDAVGETDPDGIWTQSRITLVDQSFRLERVIGFYERADGTRIPQHDWERLTLWRGGRTQPDALARRDAYRAERRTELPAHGGTAACRYPMHRDESPPPAVTWCGLFYCEACLARLLEREPQAAASLVR